MTRAFQKIPEDQFSYFDLLEQVPYLSYQNPPLPQVSSKPGHVVLCYALNFSRSTLSPHLQPAPVQWLDRQAQPQVSVLKAPEEPYGS